MGRRPIRLTVQSAAKTGWVPSGMGGGGDAVLREMFKDGVRHPSSCGGRGYLQWDTVP